MNLICTLIRRAAIATPVQDALDYVNRRAANNKELGDITKLPYVAVQKHNGKWQVANQRDVHTFGTEVEARAHILRRFW